MEYTEIQKLIDSMGESKLTDLDIEFADGTDHLVQQVYGFFQILHTKAHLYFADVGGNHNFCSSAFDFVFSHDSSDHGFHYLYACHSGIDVGTFF